jgi:DNA-directed RNA polymerase subunit L
MPHFSDLKKHNESLDFKITNVKVCIVNGLKRVCQDEILTLGFRNEPYENSTIKVITNETSSHNEIMSHRFSMIPIIFNDVETFPLEKYKFVVNVTNKSQSFVDVTTENIEMYLLETDIDSNNANEIPVTKQNTDKSMQPSALFPADRISGDHILIHNLGPGSTLHIEAMATLSNGLENALYSPVSKCIFFNTLPNMEMEKKSRVDIKLQREFPKNVDGEAFNFDFNLESIGMYDPERVILRGLIVLHDKFVKFLENTKKQINKLSVGPIKTYPNWEFTIPNEDDTLGNILYSYLFKKYITDKRIFNIISYDRVHPLVNSVTIRFGYTDDFNDDPESTFLETLLPESVSEILNIIDNLKNEWIQKFKLKSESDKIIKNRMVLEKKQEAEEAVEKGDVSESEVESEAKSEAESESEAELKPKQHFIIKKNKNNKNNKTKDENKDIDDNSSESSAVISDFSED